MPEMIPHFGPLPAPRIQFRWARGHEKATDFMPWHCTYELVIPLQETDIRRGDDEPKRDELVVTLGGGTLSSSGSCFPPFRDGAHAHWDMDALGVVLPVLVHDGAAWFREPQRSAQETAEKNHG